jgi:hypothetical protein
MPTRSLGKGSPDSHPYFDIALRKS